MRQIGLGIVGVCLVGAIVVALIYFRNQSPPIQSKDTGEPALIFDGTNPWFVDITKESGINFVHDAGPAGNYFMPDQVGSGAAVFDFNNDDLLDIYLLQNGGSQGARCRLYQQLPDGIFRDVSAGSGLDIAGYNMGVAIGDINNDGWPDVLVTRYNGIKLFLNNGASGSFTFTDVTAESGLSNPAWGSSAAFFDYDRDGWLDLVVVSYVDYDPTTQCPGPTGKRDYCDPSTYRGRVSRLFRNLGSAPAKNKKDAPIRPVVVRFEDKTEFSGLGALPGPGLGVICADFDGDGWLDIFISNDGAPNRLWMNQKNGRFKEESVLRGIAFNAMGTAQAGMGVALGDIDGDRLFDLFVTHVTSETHTFWLQGPRGQFLDETIKTKVTAAKWRGTGFGTLLADFDHDGNLDLALVNGHVRAKQKVTDWSLGPFWSYYGDRNQLFKGNGKGRFADMSLKNPDFCEHFNMGRGLVRGDLNKDGAQDLLVTTCGGAAKLFRNVAKKEGHWLQVRAWDAEHKRDAYGAEVRVRTGDRVHAGWLIPHESYLCSGEPILHFGLGKFAEFNSIEIVWPDGSPAEVFAGGKADRKIILKKGEGRTENRGQK